MGQSGLMTPEMITSELEGLKKFFSEEREKDRDEVKRAIGLVNNVQESVRTLKAGQSRKSMNGGQGPAVVEDGPYRDMDAIALRIAREWRRELEPDKSLGAHAHETWAKWGVNLNSAMQQINMLTAALDSETAGAGDELVPTSEAGSLWMDVTLESLVWALFDFMNMPTNPFDIPVELGDVNFYPGVANVATTPTTLVTAKRTLTAQEIVGQVDWAYELDEDSVVATMPMFRSHLIRQVAELLDDLALNADPTTTNGINSDGGTITDTEAGFAQFLIGWEGIRHPPLVDATGQGNSHGAGVTDAMFGEIRARLGKYGVRPSELAWIMEIKTFLRAQGISNFRTLDKLGPAATVLTGQLGQVDGIPVIVSEKMALADTDGKVTKAGNGTDTGSLLIVNRTQIQVGSVRDMQLEAVRDAKKRQNTLVVSLRPALAQRVTPSTITYIALQFNITGL